MRRPGFEPGLRAWKARVLPLDDRRFDIYKNRYISFKFIFVCKLLMGKKIFVGNLNEIGDKKVVDIDGEKIIILRYKDSYYAISGICTHEMLPMDDGWLDGEFYVCPWHMAMFNITTGKVSEETPWASDIKTFKVVVEGDKVFLYK